MKNKFNKNSVMHLSSGKLFNLYDLNIDEIDIEDIIHSLAKTCRYGGHVKRGLFYSVAEHSCLVTSIIEFNHADNYQREALFHDVAETYVQDIIKPLQVCYSEYEEFHQRVHEKIAEKFNIPKILSPEVQEADEIAYWIEKRDILECETSVSDLAKIPKHLEHLSVCGFNWKSAAKTYRRYLDHYHFNQT